MSATITKAGLLELQAAAITNDAQTLQHWIDHKTDLPVCWQVLRVLNCRIHWLRIEGLEGPQWTRSRPAGWCSGDRETTYQTARRVHGLLVLYDR